MRIHELDLVGFGHRQRDVECMVEHPVNRTERPRPRQPGEEPRRAFEERRHRRDELGFGQCIELQLPRYVVMANDDNSNGTWYERPTSSMRRSSDSRRKKRSVGIAAPSTVSCFVAR